MSASELRAIALAQVEALRQVEQWLASEPWAPLRQARTPQEVAALVTPLQETFDRMRSIRPQRPAVLRQRAAERNILPANADDLAYRNLYPGQDLGIYITNHQVGKPSGMWLDTMAVHLAQLPIRGVEVFFQAGWMDLPDLFRTAICDLLGDAERTGGVVPYPNFSEGLSALLMGLRGKLVSTAGHFTTAQYIHREWARRTGGVFVEVPLDEQECVSAQSVADALTPDTTIVSLSLVFYRNGFLQDLASIVQAMLERCPHAVLLLDVYQSMGTVPLSVSDLPPRSAVLGGGLKHFHAGPGTGYAWLSKEMLEFIEPDRIGWFGHVDPLAFVHGDWEPAAGELRFQTGGAPTTDLVSLLTELHVFASSAGGSLPDAVARTRERTVDQLERAREEALAVGLRVRGPTDTARRGPFFAVEVTDGPSLVEKLRKDGIFAGFRPDASGATSGLTRIGASSNSFGYELSYAIERIAHHMR